MANISSISLWKGSKKNYSSTPCFSLKVMQKLHRAQKVNWIKENSTFSANLARKIGSMGTKMGLLGLKIGLMYIKAISLSVAWKGLVFNPLSQKRFTRNRAQRGVTTTTSSQLLLRQQPRAHWGSAPLSDQRAAQAENRFGALLLVRSELILFSYWS